VTIWMSVDHFGWSLTVAAFLLFCGAVAAWMRSGQGV